MADIYYHGCESIPKNMPQSIHYYQKAVLAGDADAANNLGIMYEDGIGIGKDISQAFQFYMIAATNVHIITHHCNNLCFTEPCRCLLQFVLVVCQWRNGIVRHQSSAKLDAKSSITKSHLGKASTSKTIAKQVDIIFLKNAKTCTHYQ